MKLVYVTGDGDYNAVYFEDWGGTDRLKKEYPDQVAKLKDFELLIDSEDECDEVGCEEDGCDGVHQTPVTITFKQFKDVDPKFIDFIRDEIQDYDDAKCSTFYEL